MLDKRIRNIEGSPEKIIGQRNEREILRRERMTADAAKRNIIEYLEKEIPEDVIINLLSEEGVPKHFIRQEIGRQLRKEEPDER